MGEAKVTEAEKRAAINIIFDGPPGPEGGRFVEVETDDGHSIKVGEWIERTDGLWALRIMQSERERAVKLAEALRKMTERVEYLQGGEPCTNARRILAEYEAQEDRT